MVATLEANDRPRLVRRCIAESLGLELDAIQLESNLMDDLGADSLAMLDIVFRIEQVFNVQITRGEMERAARGDMSEKELAPGGVIFEAGLARLRELMFEAGDRIKAGIRPGHILTFFTVRTFLNMVEGKLRGQSI